MIEIDDNVRREVRALVDNISCVQLADDLEDIEECAWTAFVKAVQFDATENLTDELVQHAFKYWKARHLLQEWFDVSIFYKCTTLPSSDAWKDYWDDRDNGRRTWKISTE